MGICQRDVIVSDKNVGSDGQPLMKVMAECNGTFDDCGWMTEHLDEEGDTHTVGDWWVTSTEMAEYVKQHNEWSANQ